MGLLWIPPLLWAQHDTARVFLCGSAPFVIPTDQPLPRGIAAELWQQIAAHFPMPFKIVGWGSVPSALQLLEQDSIDIAVGSITLTVQRERQWDFTYPFMQSNLAIVTRPSQFSIEVLLRSLIQPALLYAIGAFLLMLFAVGLIFWVIERNVNPDIPQHWLAGIGQGVWLAIVTFTTVGYGDIAPRTSIGKVLAGVWMIVSLMIASSVVAGLASAVTYIRFVQKPITTPEDLRGKIVAGIDGTTGFAFARRHQAIVISMGSIEAMLQALVDQRVEAVVYDEPMLRYFLQTHPTWDLELVPLPVASEQYACALQPRSPYREDLNRALLQAREQGAVAEILQRWGLSQ